MKIVLCNPEVNQSFSHSRKGMYPPLGLLSLATRLEADYPGELEITVIDGDTDIIEENKFKGADIVAFHVNSFNYENVLKLSNCAKDYGAKVVYGGPHATVLWQNIMKNRPFVDYIIVNEGEVPFSRLVGMFLGKKKIDVSQIPNLVFRNKIGDYFISEQEYENTVFDMAIPSRKYIDMEKYIMNSRKIYAGKMKNIKRPFSIYSGKGCAWRERSGGCVFCARLEKKVRYRDINQIWLEVEHLKKDYNTDHIWDISDDNLNNEDWFRKFVYAKPEALRDVSFLVYTRVNRINDNTIGYLKMLNVFEVYLGFESGDPDMLKKAQKGATVKIALDSAAKLSQSGIKYFPSFVLGLPGEDIKTLENTMRFLNDLKEIGGFYRSAATILMPIPGSRVFEMISQDDEGKKIISGADIIDIKKLEKLWIKKFTRLEYNVLEEYQSKMNNITNVQTFGEDFKKKENINA